MSEEEHTELIKTALSMAFRDLNLIHEATGLFPENRYSVFMQRQINSADEITSQSGGGDSLQSVLSDEVFDDELVNDVRSAHSRMSKCSIEELQTYIEEMQQLRALQEEANRPFNRPDSDLSNIYYWVRKSIWTPEEAALLAAGKDPSPEIIDYLRNMHEFQVKESDFAASHFTTMSLLHSAIEAKEISTPGTPLEFLNWFEKVKFHVSEELMEGVLEIHAPERTIQEDKLAAEFLPRERETLLKLVAAMAVKGYRFDPEAQRNQATADIQNDLDQLGISLDQKTILKWIREACVLIEKDSF